MWVHHAQKYSLWTKLSVRLVPSRASTFRVPITGSEHAAQGEADRLTTVRTVGRRQEASKQSKAADWSGARNTFGAWWQTRLINGTIIAVHDTSENNRKRWTVHHPYQPVHQGSRFFLCPSWRHAWWVDSTAPAPSSPTIILISTISTETTTNDTMTAPAPTAKTTTTIRDHESTVTVIWLRRRRRRLHQQQRSRIWRQSYQRWQVYCWREGGVIDTDRILVIPDNRSISSGPSVSEIERSSVPEEGRKDGSTRRRQRLHHRPTTTAPASKTMVSISVISIEMTMKDTMTAPAPAAKTITTIGDQETIVTVIDMATTTAPAPWSTTTIDGRDYMFIAGARGGDTGS